MSALTSRYSVSSAPTTRTRPEPPRTRSTSPQISSAASLTLNFASLIRPIIAMSRAPRLRALGVRSSRPPLPQRGLCAIFLMAR